MTNLHCEKKETWVITYVALRPTQQQSVAVLLADKLVRSSTLWHQHSKLRSRVVQFVI